MCFIQSCIQLFSTISDLREDSLVVFNENRVHNASLHISYSLVHQSGIYAGTIYSKTYS